MISISKTNVEEILLPIFQPGNSVLTGDSETVRWTAPGFFKYFE
jgi:hypothetical protein